MNQPINDRVALRRHGRVAVILIDNPPVNALGFATREGLHGALESALGDAGVAAIVVACAGRSFSAGADIGELGKPPREPRVSTVINALENSAKPVVCAIHGEAMGGGLELALGCHYRVAPASARFSLPEVKLGIMPGAGGTQRLPRVVGLAKAIEMIVSGAAISAADAKESGLIDEIVEGDLIEGAIAFAERVADRKLAVARTRDRGDTLPVGEEREQILARARESAARKSKGRDAPLRIIDALEAAATLPFDQGIARERELCSALMNSEQARAQRYFFFAERQAARPRGLAAGTPVQEIRAAAVIGAGTMGGGIAMSLANAGIPVVLVDSAHDRLDRGLAVIRRNYENTAKRGGLSSDELEARMARIRPSLSVAEVAQADVIIEAVFENTQLKKSIFAELDRHAKAGAILGTNTSTLDIDDIATATTRPESVIGLHFFSPANVMKLLEVVRATRTSDTVLASAMALGRQIKKVPVLVGLCDGFVGNRILRARGRQSEQLVLEGALPQQVDRVLTEFGFPMGPYAMSDMAGLDIGWRIRQERGQHNPVADRLCEMGRLGQKTGAGYYRYETGSRVPVVDPLVEQIIVGASREAGIERREMADEMILQRLLYPMINEAAKILGEGVAERAGDIDAIWVHGYGWPVYRGGPMFYADLVGLPVLVERLRVLEAAHGATFRPADLLVELARDGKTFRDFDSAKKDG
jgi:3-hydroxyacyl-CoA dehydrogenase